ncbi:UNVERIFIED_CONTAM: hypothetical protein Sradi_6861600 [Sesamum radiatum]|uniref:Uncharacterized protein n=1 Tax=Sesamum radiatum TaxID=300843 RepID=A0AAW2JML5_SESRA
MVLKEQIRALRLEEGKIQYLEKVMLFGNNKERPKSWENRSLVPQDALRAAQIEGTVVGKNTLHTIYSRKSLPSEEFEAMDDGHDLKCIKFPTYRRRYRQVVKDLINYSMVKESSSKAVAYTLTKDGSIRSVTSSTAKESSTRSVSVRRNGSNEITAIKPVPRGVVLEFFGDSMCHHVIEKGET